MCEFFKTFQEEKFTESVKKVPFNRIFLIVGVSDQSSLLKGRVSVQFSNREKKKSCGLFQTLKKPQTKKQHSKTNTVKYSRVTHSELS